MRISCDCVSETAWLHHSYFSISYYTALKLPFLTFCRSFKLKKGREKGIQDEWFGLKLALSGPEFIVCMKIPSCWPRVLKVNCQTAGTIKGIIPEESQHTGKFHQSPSSWASQGTTRWNLAWMANPHLCQHLERAENISDLLLGQICWQKAIYLIPSSIIWWYLPGGLLAWVITEQNLLAWGMGRRLQITSLLQTSFQVYNVQANSLSLDSSYLLGHDLTTVRQLLWPQDSERITKLLCSSFPLYQWT